VFCVRRLLLLAERHERPGLVRGVTDDGLVIGCHGDGTVG